MSNLANPKKYGTGSAAVPLTAQAARALSALPYSETSRASSLLDLGRVGKLLSRESGAL